MSRVFDAVDLLITPTVPVPPFRIAIAEAKRATAFISGYDGANLPLPSNEELRLRGLDVLTQTDSNDDE